MASWTLVPSLVSLRNEFNQLCPDRDRSSDGSIGDPAHAASSSDHNPDETGNTPYEDADDKNEVHAIDVDDDLRKPGWDMERSVGIIVGRHRAGRDDRLQNVIYNRRIWSRSWGWTQRPYTGSNPHDKHAHFSARYGTAQENDTSPWGLLQEDDDMTKDELKAWMTEWAHSAAGREALAVAVLTWDPGVDSDGKVKPGGVANPDESSPNKTFGPNYALNRAVLAATLGYQLRERLDAVTDVARAIAVNVAKDDADLPTILARIDQARAGTTSDLRQMLGADLSNEEAAAALRSVLGVRAAAIGQLLTTG